MKKIFVTLSIIIFSISACTSDKSVTVADLAEEEKAVAAAVEQFKTAIINADRELLESIFADKLIYGHSGGKVQNKAECIEEIVSLQPNDYLSIDLAGQTIMVSGETAVVRHIYSADFTSNGAPGSLSIGNVLIWQKQDGKWKLLARQAYRL